MLASQQQSASSDGVTSQNPVQTESEGQGSHDFDPLFDDVVLEGTAAVEYLHGGFNMFDFNYGWPLESNMAGQPAYAFPEFNFGGSQLPSPHNFGSPKVFDPTAFSNTANVVGLGRQDQSSGATVNNQSNGPLSGTQMVGEEHGLPTQQPTTHGASIGAQSHQVNRQAPHLTGFPLQTPMPSQTKPHATRNPSAVTSHPRSRAVVDGARTSPTNNQARPPILAPAPDELNLGQNEGSLRMPDWLALVKPSMMKVITLRRDTHFALDILLERLPRQPPGGYSGIKIPATASVRNFAETSGRPRLEFRISVTGVASNRRYETVCTNCEKREGKKRGTPSFIDFFAANEFIEQKDGKARVEFVFCCYPKCHQDSGYFLDVVLSEDVNQTNIVAQCRLPFSFRVVAKLPQGKKRTRGQMEQPEGPLAVDQRNVRARVDDLTQRGADDERNDHPMPAINPRNTGQYREVDSSIMLPPAVSLPQPLWNAGPSAGPVSPWKPPNPAIAPPSTDGETGPTPTEVNPESGSIPDGTRATVNNQGTSSGPPPEAVTTNLRRESVDESELQAINPPPSTVRGIDLATPRPANGETMVQVRRDTCITLSFDMRCLSKGSATYDGLKIPSTPSVRSHCSENGKTLLHLDIRVLGATTRNEYRTVCHICKDREGDRDAFPDFRAKGNILVPKKNGKLLVSFTLACYSKHREPQDSEYCLKVILNGGAEQNNPLIECELPYSFSIVTRLPPRTRNQGEDVETVGDATPPPNKRPRTRSGHAGRAGNPAPQSTVSSGRDDLSSGDSRGSTNGIPPGTSQNPVPPMNDFHPAPPAEAVMPSHQYHQTVNTPSGEETADGRNLVIESINPSQGPTAGGPEIWISGSNFPTGLIPLYAKFGDNFAYVVVRKPDLLSCRLPQANVPGTVPVSLSRSPDPNAPVMGTSLCQFRYLDDLDEMLPVIIRIQKDCTPGVAAGLDSLIKERNLKRNEKRPLRGEGTRHDEIETALIQALAPLQNTLNFGGLISKTNDYKQTLAHFAVLYGYSNLLKRLVGWNIDLTIADVNGFTALHSAYKKGDRVCVDLLLEKGASETVLDALGRAPSHLMPEGFASLKDHDTDMTSDGQPELERKLDSPSPFQGTDSRHVVSDSRVEKAVNKAGLADLMQQSPPSSVARNSHNSLSLSGIRVVDGRNNAPVLPLTIHPPIIIAPIPFPDDLHPFETHRSPQMAAIVLNPKMTDGYFPYRQNITARISLIGNIPPGKLVLASHPPLNESRLMGATRLLCHAVCQPCMSQDSSPPQSCNPIAFYLHPTKGLKYERKTFCSNIDRFNCKVTFEIPQRPRNPRAEGQARRCSSESLILTFSLYDDAGNVLAQTQAPGPFRARAHSKRADVTLPSRRPSTAPCDRNGSLGVMDDLPLHPLPPAFDNIPDTATSRDVVCYSRDLDLNILQPSDQHRAAVTTPQPPVISRDSLGRGLDHDRSGFEGVYDPM